MTNTLTVIPAKLNSVRLPKKNITRLGGKPLIAYTIEAALKSGVCGEVMVSTESEEIARIAASAGAGIPFMRPDHLGSDPYGVVDVCLNVLDCYQGRAKEFEKMIILLPTSPFRSPNDIIEANGIYDRKNAKFLMSVSKFEHNPLNALYLNKDDDGVMLPSYPQYLGKKRHEVPVTYRVNGAVCIVEVNAFRKAGTYYGTPLYGYVMPWWRSIDIDTAIDFTLAEFLLEKGILDELDKKNHSDRP